MIILLDEERAQIRPEIIRLYDRAFPYRDILSVSTFMDSILRSAAQIVLDLGWIKTVQEQSYKYWASQGNVTDGNLTDLPTIAARMRDCSDKVREHSKLLKILLDELEVHA
jgi:hypothetical protein